jgi:hypothetical protein
VILLIRIIQLNPAIVIALTTPIYATISAIKGILVCPIQLTASVDNENVITVRWTKYNGWQSGVTNYELQKFDKSGGLMATLNLGTDTVWVDNQPDDVNQVLQYLSPHNQCRQVYQIQFLTD